MATKKKVVPIKKDEPALQLSANSAWAFELDKLENWAYWNNLFSPVECEKIIETGTKRISQIGNIGPDNHVNKDLRECEIAWLYAADDMAWVFQRVTAAVSSLNERFFGFDLFGMAEGFQFTKYDAPSGKYGAHIDRGLNMVPRKLSVSILLNPRESFEGGDLLMYETLTPNVQPMQQGQLIAFPSYVLHEVTPVTKGTRYSLVCWITGKPFK